MATKQAVLPGIPFAIFVNETSSRQAPLPAGLMMNETVVTVAPTTASSTIQVFVAT